MTRYRATTKGNIPLTEEEEAEFIATQKFYALTQDKRVAESVRAERDYLLAETDWMALSDVTMSEEWAAYRQELRDISNQEGFPYNVIFPAKPSTLKEAENTEEVS